MELVPLGDVTDNSVGSLVQEVSSPTKNSKVSILFMLLILSQLYVW